MPHYHSNHKAEKNSASPLESRRCLQYLPKPGVYFLATFFIHSEWGTRATHHICGTKVDHGRPSLIRAITPKLLLKNGLGPVFGTAIAAAEEAAGIAKQKRTATTGARTGRDHHRNHTVIMPEKQRHDITIVPETGTTRLPNMVNLRRLAVRQQSAAVGAVARDVQQKSAR